MKALYTMSGTGGKYDYLCSSVKKKGNQRISAPMGGCGLGLPPAPFLLPASTQPLLGVQDLTQSVLFI